MKIVLDAAEERIRKLLLNFSREFARRGYPDVTLRFTGGWVRDKLLGRKSHDIDVAIDKATGEEFASELHNYMVATGEAESKVHKINMNPEKSKHLETATTRICGLDIDFVNLRSEEYANSSSRVPSTVKFGTPAQDAFRRDATLNALFYNLSTGLVEDFTGKGLDDLRAGVLRTPLDPYETFMDDPLRVLRLIRFVGQLGFRISDETLPAMRGESIGDAIQNKVSGERVGTEILKLVESPHAEIGLRYLVNLDLGPHILAVPNVISAETPHLQRHLDELEEALPKLKPDLQPQTPVQMGMLTLGLLLQDMNKDVKVGPKKKDVANAVEFVIKEGLKLTRAMKDGVMTLLGSGAAFDELVAARAESDLVPRHLLGTFVRKNGDLWRLCIAYNGIRARRSDSGHIDDANDIYAAIRSEGLEDAHKLKPLIEGKTVMDLLQKKPGPWLKVALDDAMKYQLDHPGSSSDDMKEWLLTNYKAT